MMRRHSDTAPTLRRQLKYNVFNGLCKMSACRREILKNLRKAENKISARLLKQKCTFWRTYIFRADSADTPTNEVKLFINNVLRYISCADKMTYCADTAPTT